MPEQREALKFEPNQPVELTIMFDEPKTGESQHGPWSLWGVRCDGEQMSWFPSDGCEIILANLDVGKGTDLTVTKRAKKNDDGNPINYFEIVDTDGDMHSTLSSNDEPEEHGAYSDSDLDEYEDAVPEPTVEKPKAKKATKVATEELIPTPDKFDKFIACYRRCLETSAQLQEEIIPRHATAESITAGAATLFIQASMNGLCKNS